MVWRSVDGQAGDLGERTPVMEGERWWQNVKKQGPNGLKRRVGAHRKWNRPKPTMEMVKSVGVNTDGDHGGGLGCLGRVWRRIKIP
jgi:hypothetical protein